MNMTDCYIGEYSHIQKCYHIITFEEALKINCEMAKQGVFNDYIPICYGFSYKEVQAKLDKIQEEMGRP